MPHKRNPVLSENLTGLARMVRAYVTPALENVALWHERDISHSSVERMIGPDATVTLDFALSRLAGIIDKLVVYPENMRKNLDRLGGLVHSQRVLIALTQKGVAREDAYRLVQRNAMKVWRGEGDFLALLKADKDVRKHLSEAELEGQFRPRLSLQARRYDLQAGVRQQAVNRALDQQLGIPGGRPLLPVGSLLEPGRFFDAVPLAPGAIADIPSELPSPTVVSGISREFVWAGSVLVRSWFAATSQHCVGGVVAPFVRSHPGWSEHLRDANFRLSNTNVRTIWFFMALPFVAQDPDAQTTPASRCWFRAESSKGEFSFFAASVGAPRGG